MFKLKPTLRLRIYVSMLALIIVSLIVIGVTTVIYFNTESEQYDEDRLKRKEKTVVLSLSYFFRDADINADFNVVSRDFEEEITKLADINRVELNIYNLQGEALLTSHLENQDENFFTKNIDAIILLELKTTGERQVETINDDKISTYSILKAKDGKTPIAIVNIPYDRTKSPEVNGLTPYLTRLIEIYVFLLIGAGLLAYFLSNYITKGIRTISEKLKDVQINKKNEPLVWSGNDEISTLVSHYNSMIGQLEESASKLAKTERESAWREMAKQVAHEIKNPLTPMKLSVQHLERALQPDDPDFKDKMSRFSSKMVTQIDALTSIANEFSNFAKMPKSKMEQIDLSQILNSSVDLFSEHNEVAIHFDNSGLVTLPFKGDKEQLTRVFNNIIKNAIQAIPDEKKGKIDVVIHKENNDQLIRIKFKDNGSGIPEDEYDKIFVPNFTTKNSGSGLGLAMVKQIVQAHQGEIYFTSVLGEGTVFIVDLPY